MRPLLTILLLVASAIAQTSGFYSTKITPKLSGCCTHVDLAINQIGEVTGISTIKMPDGTSQPRVFVWSPYIGMNDLGFGYEGTAINNNGDVVGSSTGEMHGGGGFLWVAGSNTAMSPFGHARAVNNNQVVVGDSSTGAFRWDIENGVVDLGWGANSVAYGINDAGTIVGCKFISGVSHAVVDGNDIQNFGFESCATAISPNGTVTGWVHDNDGGHGFIWHQGDSVMTDMGVPFGGGGATPSAINDRESVVGTDNSGAFLWTPATGYRDLNAMSGNKPMTMTVATGINSWGQIVTRERRVLTPIVHVSLTSDSDLSHVTVGALTTFTAYSYTSEGPVPDGSLVEFRLGGRLIATGSTVGGFVRFPYSFPYPGYPFTATAIALAHGPLAKASARAAVYVYPQ